MMMMGVVAVAKTMLLLLLEGTKFNGYFLLMGVFSSLSQLLCKETPQ